jgi:phenylalanyl-tRNA synthetase beta chain
MPVVGLPTRVLRALLGTDLSTEKIAEAIDQIGCDLEEVSVEHLFRCPSCAGVQGRLPREDPPKVCDRCGHASDEPFEESGSEEMVRLDLLPARPDLFDAGGLSRAIVGYLGIRTGLPESEVVDGGVVVKVDPSVLGVRPEIACAEIVLPAIDEDTLVAIFRLQEDLHWAVGRDRKRASIGVYDMRHHGTVIHWTTKPRDFEFVPLGMPGETMTLDGILESHPKGTAYAHLLEGFDRYPVLIDDEGQVLSMPPIINSEETKLVKGAERLFIDVTGPDRRAVDDSLALLVASVREYGGEVRSVRIENGEETRVTPDLTPVKWTVDPARAARLIGVDLSTDDVVERLDRMRIGVDGVSDDGGIEVSVPRYRVDVKHQVDLIEDIAIAHGFHNLPTELVPTMTVGRELPVTTLSRGIRRVLTGLGFFEVMTFVLTNEEEHSELMRLPTDLGQVEILNPISVQQTIMRAQLLSSMMATFARNKTREMPQRIFEIGDVAAATEGACEQSTRLAFGVMGPRADYATIMSTMEALFHEAGLDLTVAPGEDHEYAASFLPGRVATVSAGGTALGVMGEVHPEVITGFGLDHPVVLAEIDVDVLLGLIEE